MESVGVWTRGHARSGAVTLGEVWGGSSTRCAEAPNAPGWGSSSVFRRPGLMGTVKVRLIWKVGRMPEEYGALGGRWRRVGAQVWWRQHARLRGAGAQVRLRTAVRWM